MGGVDAGHSVSFSQVACGFFYFSPRPISRKGKAVKKIKDEIKRIESAKGNMVLVNKASYLSILKELSILRFKVRKAEDWTTPAQVLTLSREGYMARYWKPDANPAKSKGEKKMADQVEVTVAKEKVAAFQKYLEENQIQGFGLQDFQNEVHAQAFRSNLAVEGTNLPFMILLDDSVYTMLQVQIASGIAVGDKKEKICTFLNDLNEQYRMLKYSADASGNVILTCCIPAGVPHFEPALVIAILNQLQGHLNALYPEIMKQLWAK